MSYTNAKTHHPCPWGRGTISLTRFLPPSFPLSLHLDAIKEVKALVARLYAEMKVMAVRIITASTSRYQKSAVSDQPSGGAQSKK